MRLFAALILCSLPLAAAAQEKAPPRTCRILFLKAPQDAPRSLWLDDGSTCQEVELPRMNLSRIYQIAPGPVTLRLLPSAPAADEKPDPQAPSVKLAAEITDFYLLLAPDPTNPVAPVRMSVINVGISEFGKGHMLWFNTSDKAVAGNVGKQRLTIAPNERKILAPPADAKEEYPVNLAFLVPGEEKPRLLCETQWRHDPASRTVLFILTEEGTRTPRVLGFPDRRESAPNPQP
jgi:hypothetical protein